MIDISYCSYGNCPIKECERYLWKAPRGAMISVTAFKGCEFYPKDKSNPVICAECDNAEIVNRTLFCKLKERTARSSKPKWCPLDVK